MIIQRSTGSSDVLQLAKNWNIKIIHVEGCLFINLYIIHYICCIDIVKYFSKYPVGAELSLNSDQHKLLSPGGLCSVMCQQCCVPLFDYCSSQAEITIFKM